MTSFCAHIARVNMASISRGLNGRGHILLYHGYRYQKNKSHNTTITWRCWRKQCRANLVTNIFDVTSRAPRIHVRKVSTKNLIVLNGKM